MKRSYHDGDEGSIPERTTKVLRSSLDCRTSIPQIRSELAITAIDQGNRSIQTLNLLDTPTYIKSNATIVLELWVYWLASEIKIQDDGRVQCYAEWYIPGWLLLQIGRSLWPNLNDRRKDGRLTSISILGILRGPPDNGYMVDRLSFYNWLHITCYDAGRCQAKFRWLAVEEEITNEVCYQILSPGQVCKNMNKPGMYCWVEIPDINVPIPLYDFLEDIE